MNTFPECNLIWLVDARHDVNIDVRGKVIRLAKVYQAPITIIVHERLRTSERKYWFSLDNSESMNQSWREEHGQLARNLQRSIEGSGVEVRLILLSSANYLDEITSAIKPNCSNFLIVQDEKPMVRHSVFQELVNLPCNTLILTKTPWHKDLKILGAVDPLHENARPADLDFKIVKNTRSLAEHLRANWLIGHSCFVPATFIQYKSKFQEIHQDGLQDFIEEFNIPRNHSVLLHGMPEKAIEAWLKKHNADLLVIGFVARNILMSHLIGSTTTALLNQPPTDMLLVKSMA